MWSTQILCKQKFQNLFIFPRYHFLSFSLSSHTLTISLSFFQLSESVLIHFRRAFFFVYVIQSFKNTRAPRSSPKSRPRKKRICIGNGQKPQEFKVFFFLFFACKFLKCATKKTIKQTKKKTIIIL